jgi:hypothetical protein
MPKVTITVPAVFTLDVPDDSPLDDLALIDLAVCSLRDVRQWPDGFTYVTMADASEVCVGVRHVDFTFDFDEDNPQHYVRR